MKIMLIFESHDKIFVFGLYVTHPFELKFVVICPKFSWDSYVEFQEKTIPGEFLGKTREISPYFPKF